MVEAQVEQPSNRFGARVRLRTEAGVLQRSLDLACCAAETKVGDERSIELLE